MTKRILALFVSLAVALTAFAGGDKKAGKIGSVSHEELKAAVASGKVVLLDVNGSQRYAQGHIPGAVDYTAVKSSLASVLPGDKDALIVAYCGGPSCGAYKEAADAALALGYKNVKHYAGGISGWEEKGERTQKKT
ncbi:MAG TPA: rhodanese-like domain-containing protein [Opitutaceae bacterium]|nr:rhodanese-like domain-containing protein [Opitutaceae bacterium]